MLLDAVGPCALVGFGGLDDQAELLPECRGYKRARGVRKPPGRFHDLRKRRATPPFQQADNQLGLTAVARAAGALRLGGFPGRQLLYVFAQASNGHLVANYWNGSWHWADQGL